MVSVMLYCNSGKGFLHMEDYKVMPEIGDYVRFDSKLFIVSHRIFRSGNTVEIHVIEQNKLGELT